MKITFDSVWFTDGTGTWAMDEMIEAFLHEDSEVNATGFNTEYWNAGMDDNDRAFYTTVYETMNRKVPTTDRIILYCSCYSEVYFWEGPLMERDILWSEIEERFRKFSRVKGPEILKEAITKIVQRGLGFGMDRDDMVALVDEVLVEGVMSS